MPGGGAADCADAPVAPLVRYASHNGPSHVGVAHSDHLAAAAVVFLCVCLFFCLIFISSSLLSNTGVKEVPVRQMLITYYISHCCPHAGKDSILAITHS